MNKRAINHTSIMNRSYELNKERIFIIHPNASKINTDFKMFLSLLLKNYRKCCATKLCRVTLANTPRVLGFTSQK